MPKRSLNDFAVFRGILHERGFDLRLVPSKLIVPFEWKQPRRIFVNSMSDLFHEDVPTDYILRVARTMKSASWHTFQVLTKRATRLRDLLDRELYEFSQLPHIWWGAQHRQLFAFYQ